MYIDADHNHLYLFTYTTPNYPFTPPARAAALKKLKDSLRVCYKDKDCLGVN